MRDHRFGPAYLFGAVCPERDTGVAPALTRASTAAMDLLLAELARALPPKTHSVVLLDSAGWHMAADLDVPTALTLVPLPRYSPELNASETVWQYLRDTRFSRRLCASTAAIVDACCAAWNALLGETGRIRSLCSFPWPLQVTN